MLTKVISGGQTGADQAGLVAARDAGIATGGCAPKGWKTQDGPAPWLGTDFGLVEHASPQYPPRTEVNAGTSDGTLWFGRTTSAGFRCTQKACIKNGRPFRIFQSVEDAVKWITDTGICVLNVAGNRENTNPGIYESTYWNLTEILCYTTITTVSRETTPEEPATRYWHHPESSCIFTTENGEQAETDGLVEEIEEAVYLELQSLYAAPASPVSAAPETSLKGTVPIADRNYFDFETTLTDGFRLETIPICKGLYADRHSSVLLPSDCVSWLRRLLRSGADQPPAVRPKGVGFALAFDMLQFFRCPSFSTADVLEILQAYADGRLIDIRCADKLTSIQAGDFERRVFTLAEAYKARTGKVIADQKGMNHPIIGAYKKGVKKDQKLAWLKAFGAAQRAYISGDRTAADTALAAACAIVPLADVPWRYKYAFLYGLPLAMWPAEAKAYVIADCKETAELGAVVCSAAQEAQVPIDLDGVLQSGYLGPDGLPLHTAFESAMDFGLQLMCEVGFFIRDEYVSDMVQFYEETRAETQDALFMKGLIKVRKTGEHKGTLGMDAKEVQEMVRDAFVSEGLEPPLSEGGEAQKAAWTAGNRDPKNAPEEWATKRDKNTLLECPGRKAELYRAWQTAQRMCEVKLPLLQRKPLRTAINSMVITSRTSSGADEENGGAEFNSQNLDKEGGVQQAFRPPTMEEMRVIQKRLHLPKFELEPGDRYVILDADYATLECHTGATQFIYRRTGRMGYQPGVSELADDLMLETDIHSKIAVSDWIMRGYRAADGYDFSGADFDEAYKYFRVRRKKDPEYALARQTKKPVIFGALGMMGAYRLAMQAFSLHGIKLGCHENGMWDPAGSVEVAKRSLAICLELYPDIAEHRQQGYDGGTDQLAYCMPSMLQRGRCLPTEWGNWAIQPEAARIFKRAIFGDWRKIYDVKRYPAFAGCTVFIGVHDSIGMYVPESQVHEASLEHRRTMLDSKEVSCPGMTKDSQVVPVATEVMEKSAEPTYRDGRLVVTPCSIPVAKRPEFLWHNHPRGAYGWLLEE